MELDEIPEDSASFRRADVDGDGKITAEDARNILRMAVGETID